MLEQFKRYAVLLSLVKELRSNGSWTGETHVQKGTYFLQELTQVPLGLQFILYKYGPFSFELRDELTAMQANLLISLKTQPPYGPSLVPGELSERLMSAHEKTISQFRNEVQFVGTWLGRRGVAELERLSTALMVVLEHKDLGDREKARRLRQLKSHVSSEEAEAAIIEVTRMREAYASVNG